MFFGILKGEDASPPFLGYLSPFLVPTTSCTIVVFDWHKGIAIDDLLPRTHPGYGTKLTAK